MSKNTSSKHSLWLNRHSIVFVFLLGCTVAFAESEQERVEKADPPIKSDPLGNALIGGLVGGIAGGIKGGVGGAATGAAGATVRGAVTGTAIEKAKDWLKGQEEKK